ncbi:MAG: 3-hydroxyacyl-CoA dehydrogenase/enoyl-CoA hydratase family protein [Acidobacteriota bacterium]
MTSEIKHVAVIGGGIMGGGIAALFANQQIGASVFDLDLPLAKKCIALLEDPNAKIPLLYTTKYAKYIKPFAISQYAEELGKADVIIEAVPEVMKIKKQTFQEIDKHRKPGSIVATNTSGLSVSGMVDGCSEDMRKHFLGTHFFNPVRFLPLVELIPGKDTVPGVIETMRDYFVRIGKKPVVGRDTPNFIANRVGIFQIMKVFQLMEKYGLSVDQIDMITGPALGNPRTATFRLADMVGVDTLYHAAMNQYQNCPDDEEREHLKPTALLDRMVSEKKLGEKTKCGFFTKEKDKIKTLDVKSWEYKDKTEPKSDVVRGARGYARAADRIRAMMGSSQWPGGDDVVCRFSREIVLASAAYAMNRIGEVAGDLLTIDNAMKWGFAKEVGPIEILDSIGLEKSAEMMQECSIRVPQALKDAIGSTRTLCKQTPVETLYFDVGSKSMKSVPARADAILLKALKDRNKVVRENLSARIYDLDDGVLLLEIASSILPEMNPIDDYVISMIGQAIREVKKGHRALVIGSQGQNFCAGANIQMMLEMAKARMFTQIEQVSMALQMANMALYHADFPVVTAPHGLTLGGGQEITLAGQVRVAHAELYCGLVEVGVGLVPAGGGCLQLLAQLIETTAKDKPGPMPPAMKALDLIGWGRVSKSAHDAIDQGLLRPTDVIVFDKDLQIRRAKEVAIGRLTGFEPIPQRELTLPGKGGFYVIEDNLKGALKQKKVTEHSLVIALKQARILTGGERASSVNPVDENYILELEREEFVSLCGMPKTQERMAYMLKNGKPLIN